VCVSAPQEAEALEVIKKSCDERDASLVLIGRDLSFEEISSGGDSQTFSVKGLFGEYKNIHTGMLGHHQVVNAAVAIGIIESLRLSGITAGAQAVRKGLGSVKWPGRLEMINGSPRVLLDGAQNGSSARALSASVRKLFKYRKLILVLGVSKDKDIKGILKELIPISDAVVLTRSRIAQRAADPSYIAGMITPKEKVAAITESGKDALDKALSAAAPQDLVLVTGSLFVVGEIRKILLKDTSDE
jgi:dihydrofolate synthase/folylpolyglutamate synthase